MAPAGGVALMVCFEQPNTGKWCHRALGRVAATALGGPIPDLGFEDLAQQDHPLMHDSLRRPVPLVAGVKQL